jgi:ferrous iron transport protein B
MIILYFSGILIGILVELLFKTTLFRGKPVPFVMELPNYRIPSLKTVLLLMWDKAKDFLQKAFTVIFVGTLIIWFLQKFDARFNIVTDSSQSLLAQIGKFLAPVFEPLGFGDWRITTSLISGFTAKEAVVSTLGVLTHTSNAELQNTLSSMLSSLSAASFLIFTLLYTPCVAAVAAIKRELASRTKTILIVLFQCAIAWAAAFAVYNIGSLIF